MPYKTKPFFADNAEATESGWTIPLAGTNPADGLTELIVAIRQLTIKAGPATIESVTFGAASYEPGDALSVIVRFSERVNAEEGSRLDVISTGDDTQLYSVYCLEQLNVLEVVFDQVSDLDEPVIISEADTATFELSIESPQNISSTITDADSSALEANSNITGILASAAGIRTVVVI